MDGTRLRSHRHGMTMSASTLDTHHHPIASLELFVLPFDGWSRRLFKSRFMVINVRGVIIRHFDLSIIHQVCHVLRLYCVLVARLLPWCFHNESFRRTRDWQTINNPLCSGSKFQNVAVTPHDAPTGKNTTTTTTTTTKTIIISWYHRNQQPQSPQYHKDVDITKNIYHKRIPDPASEAHTNEATPQEIKSDTTSTSGGNDIIRNKSIW